jgi:hypothetical protein
VAQEGKMNSRYKAAVAGLFLAGIGCALLFHGRAATAAEASQIPFTFVTVDVPVPGAGSTMVVGINNLGDMVGSYNFIPGAGALGLPAGFLGKGFVWQTDGTFTTIDGPGPVNPQLCQPPQSFQNCYYIEARGINDRGDVVGAYSQDVLNPQGGLFRAFYQQAGGEFTSYLFPGHTNTIFNRIKETGVIYGCFHDEGIDNSSQESMHAITNLLRPDGTIRNINFKAESSTMNVGGGPAAVQYAGVWYDFEAQRHRAYIFTGGERVDFDMPGSNLTQAWDMNVQGDVVGVWGNNTDPIAIDGIPFHGYLRDRSGNFIAIDYPGSIDTHVFGINSWGDIVGSYVDKSNNIHGFLARPGDQLADVIRSARPAIVNGSSVGARATTDVHVAMMPVIPKDKPLLSPSQVPACHRIGRK